MTLLSKLPFMKPMGRKSYFYGDFIVNRGDRTLSKTSVGRAFFKHTSSSLHLVLSSYAEKQRNRNIVLLSNCLAIFSLKQKNFSRSVDSNLNGPGSITFKADCRNRARIFTGEAVDGNLFVAVEVNEQTLLDSRPLAAD